MVNIDQSIDSNRTAMPISQLERVDVERPQVRSMPRVSILMPTFNYSTYIVEAIESVLSQTYKDWELIVVDDGSTDDTADVIHQFASDLTYIYQPNRGCPAALNRAFKASNGQYILILASDDWLLPESLETLAHYLDANPQVDLVCSDGYVATAKESYVAKLSEHHHLPFGDTLDSFVVTSPVAGIHTTMIRRSALESMDGPFDETMYGYEDRDLFIRLKALECKFARIHELTCCYRMHPGNKSASDSPLAEKRRESLIRNRFKILEAPFFPGLSNMAKRQFLYMMLMDQLQGESELQERVLRSEGFASLPADARSVLLYHLAVENITVNHQLRLGRERLRLASQLSPTNWKPQLALALSACGQWPLATMVNIRRLIGRPLQKKARSPQPLPAGHVGRPGQQDIEV